MSTPVLPEGHEWCTTWSHRKRHISTDLAPARHAPRPKGRSGRTLCGNSGDDEERTNWWLDTYGVRKTVKLANLTPCVPCARKVAKATPTGSASDHSEQEEQA